MTRSTQSQLDSHKPHRRSIRLRDYDYAQAGAYFVTLVSHQRRCVFGEIVAAEMRLNECGAIADECWRAIPDHFPSVELGAYVIMPNHVHGIIIINASAVSKGAGMGAAVLRPNVRPGSLGAIVRSYKSAVSYRIHQEHTATPIWQRNYYEHIIRTDHALQRITAYIYANPARWAEDNDNPVKAKT